MMKAGQRRKQRNKKGLDPVIGSIKIKTTRL